MMAMLLEREGGGVHLDTVQLPTAERNLRAAFFVTRSKSLVHYCKYILLKWNYVARSFCDIVDKISKSKVDVVHVRAKSTNCPQLSIKNACIPTYINVRIIVSCKSLKC